jgi:hypothetical protein
MQLAETRSGKGFFPQRIVVPADKKKSRMVRLGRAAHHAQREAMLING